MESRLYWEPACCLKTEWEATCTINCSFDVSEDMLDITLDIKKMHIYTVYILHLNGCTMKRYHLM